MRVRNEYSLYQPPSLKVASAKAGIDPKTARKHLKDDTLKPPEVHTWKTRPDVFEDVWLEIKTMLSAQQRLEAKTILEFLIKYQHIL